MATRTLSTLRAGSPLRHGELAIVPVERSRVSVACVSGRLIADMRKDVAAIVLVTTSGEQALGPSGEVVEVAELLARTNGLREALERSRSSILGGLNG